MLNHFQQSSLQWIHAAGRRQRSRGLPWIDNHLLGCFLGSTKISNYERLSVATTSKNHSLKSQEQSKHDVCMCSCRVRGFSWEEATFAQLYSPQKGTHADLSKPCTEVLLMNQWVLLGLLTGNSDTGKELLTYKDNSPAAVSPKIHPYLGCNWNSLRNLKSTQQSHESPLRSLAGEPLPLAAV